MTVSVQNLFSIIAASLCTYDEHGLLEPRGQLTPEDTITPACTENHLLMKVRLTFLIMDTIVWGILEAKH